MRLWEALQVRKGDVVSFVGAGGKTTAMYRLGWELAGQGWRVITTTTTMIRPPPPDQTAELIVAEQVAQLLRLTEAALRTKNPVTVASERLSAENKLKGIDGDWVADLRSLADAVIVEADGARGLPLKAPAEHEPVVPTVTTVFVPVVGMDAVGRRLTEDTAHRPNLVAKLTGLAYGEIISPSVLSTLLVHPRGALKGSPGHARVAPLINQVQDGSTLASARQIAAQTKGNRALDRVLIGAVASDDPVRESWRRVSAVVLAAGESRRFGQLKQLLPIARTTMLERVLNVVMASGVDEVVVVLGHSAAQVAGRIPAGCRTVLNECWEEGISSSIRTGLKAVDPGVEAALFVLADQPRITRAALERILHAYFGATKGIVVPTYRGQRGSPVLFDRCLFAELQVLSGDVGGRQLMARFPDQVLAVEMESPEMFADIDAPADYERFLEQAE